MARKELGNRWTCENCETKFFDLNQTPVSCPRCKITIPSNETKNPAPRNWRYERTSAELSGTAKPNSEDGLESDTSDEEDLPNDQVDPGFDNPEDLVR